ncbi:hypothetical protein ACJIZ3_000974 [Penstemon smallii]|uniref:Uncharacterized protein n=1 Tax=Penstemon smallii TaxID=265156 RepID=A0ABD3U408_9LAMI
MDIHPLEEATKMEVDYNCTSRLRGAVYSVVPVSFGSLMSDCPEIVCRSNHSNTSPMAFFPLVT